MKRFSVFCLQLCLALLLVLPMGALSASSSVAAEADQFSGGRGWHWGYRHGWDSRASSEFARITGWAREPRGDGYAIIIGISDYLDEGYVYNNTGMDLLYADDDAITMAGTLIGVYGYNPDNVTLLLGESGVNANPGSILATRKNIMKAIRDVRKKVERGDEVVFFFAGHGLQAEIGRADGDWELIDEGILAYDLKPIWDGKLATAFRWFKTNRIVFMFDCCNAGGMTDLARWGRIVLMACEEEYGIALEYGEPYEQMLAYLLTKPVGPFKEKEVEEMLAGLLMLLGSYPDYPDHGLFTYFFAVGIQSGMADVYDHDGDGIVGDLEEGIPGEPEDVTIEEAFNFASGSLQQLSAQMSDYGFAQYPQISDRFWGDLLP